MNLNCSPSQRHTSCIIHNSFENKGERTVLLYKVGSQTINFVRREMKSAPHRALSAETPRRIL